MIRHALIALPFVVMLWAHATGSHAEKADRKKAVVIDGGLLDGMGKEGSYSLVNGVTIVQGTLRISGDRADVKVDKSDRYHAVLRGGPTCFRQKKDNIDEWIMGQADRMEYDQAKDTVQLFGNVVMHDGNKEFKGDYTLYNIATEQMQAKPKASGQIRMILLPKDNAEDADDSSEAKPGAPSKGTPKAVPKSLPKAAPGGRPNPTALPEKTAASLRAALDLEPTRHEPLASKCTEKAL